MAEKCAQTELKCKPLCLCLCSDAHLILLHRCLCYLQTRFYVRFSLSFFSSSDRNLFSMQRPYELDESCAMFGNAHFDVLKKTVLYIHGYQEGPNEESVNVIVDSYLQRNDHNILVLDWSQLANGNYLIDAVPNAKQVFLFPLLCIVWRRGKKHANSFRAR